MNSFILNTLVLVSCSNPGDGKPIKACSSFVEATARYSGVYGNIERWEKKQTQYAYEKANKYLGPKAVSAITSTGLIINVAQGKRTLFKMGKGPLGGSYHLETDGRKMLVLGIGWDF